MAPKPRHTPPRFGGLVCMLPRCACCYGTQCCRWSLDLVTAPIPAPPPTHSLPLNAAGLAGQRGPKGAGQADRLLRLEDLVDGVRARAVHLRVQAKMRDAEAKELGVWVGGRIQQLPGAE